MVFNTPNRTKKKRKRSSSDKDKRLTAFQNFIEDEVDYSEKIQLLIQV